MTIKENIEAIMMEFDINQDGLARLAEVSPSSVTGWMQGSMPGKKARANLCEALGITEDDILSERSGMAAKRSSGFRNFNSSVSYAVVGSVEVPVLGKVHAGEPLDHDEVEDTTRIPDFVYAKDPDVFMIHSEGDCVNKLFGENDDFAVSPNTKPKNGSVVVAKLMRADEEEYIIRQYFRTAQTLILSPCSYNPEHKDIIITTDSDMSAEISGVIIWNQARRLMD